MSGNVVELEDVSRRFRKTVVLDLVRNPVSVLRRMTTTPLTAAAVAPLAPASHRHG